MKKYEIIQFLKFCVIGLGNTLINLAMLYLLTSVLGLYYIISEIFAFIAGTINSFIWNSMWTFKSRGNHLKKYSKFLIVNIISLGANLFILYLFTDRFRVYYLLSELIATLVSLMIGFIGNKIWTFGESRDYSLIL